MLRPIQFVPHDTRIDFLSRRLTLLAVSVVFLLTCLGSLLVQGLNFGIDFTGGILIEARTETPADLGALRGALNTVVSGEIALTTVGDSGRDLMIRVPEQPGGEGANTEALERIKDRLGDGVEYRRTELVGPKVGGELITAGAMAMGLAILIITAYIWFRFEWQYAIGGILALLHDVLATLGLFSLFQLQFDLTSVAAVLTVAGYSINDTVVIFDRVREELRRHKSLPLPEVLNLAINRTLSRTVLTSGTTMLAVLFLLVFGGDVLQGFSLAILWGIVVGTYSSVYVAVPSLVFFRFTRSGEADPDAPEDEGGEGGGAQLAARAARAEAEVLGETEPGAEGRTTPRKPGVVVGRARSKKRS